MTNSKNVNQNDNRPANLCRCGELLGSHKDGNKCPNKKGTYHRIGVEQYAKLVAQKAKDAEKAKAEKVDVQVSTPVTQKADTPKKVKIVQKVAKREVEARKASDQSGKPQCPICSATDGKTQKVYKSGNNKFTGNKQRYVCKGDGHDKPKYFWPAAATA